MQSDIQMKKQVQSISMMNTEKKYLSTIYRNISEAWKKIAPFWPLKNLIAVNPLQGLEDLSFQQAFMTGQSYFQQAKLPTTMEDINRETIKWCQAFFDEGQATIKMPFRDRGFYHAWRQLVRYDKRLHLNREHRIWLENLPETAEQTITACLIKLNIPHEKSSLFFILLLTTLPGWASYIKYRTEWSQANQIDSNPVTQADYLAIRLMITCLLWPEAINLLDWHQDTHKITASEQIKKIIKEEKNYQTALLNLLSEQDLKTESRNNLHNAQFVFCIDVRAEPFRRALEAQGNYETFGFAGFFGIPTQVKNELTEESYSSCPVLLSPKHTVNEKMFCSAKIAEKVSNGKEQINNMRRLYQALKYTFTTPFALVELLGLWSGLWMLIRTMVPTISINLKKNLLEFFCPTPPVRPILITQDATNGIDFNDQCTYAESALCMMGLTDNFSPIVILCGHGSSTQNNAYASALDCGACGGHQGAANARILAAILNNMDVRNYLANQNILIPLKTRFIAALHNTTTDEITLYLNENESMTEELNKIKHDLEKAQQVNNEWRCEKMGYINNRKNNCMNHVKNRNANWAETRPEWGLARNASFIIGPRHFTKQVDLDGRAFLHSYHWEQDNYGIFLTTILTAPMVVAQWINSQYLFSSIDNVAYGSGSKITHNITGKVGIMQGNGSDLMHGLPLQSINRSDTKPYHQPLRLTTIVYAPRTLINDIITRQAILQTLFGNEWVKLICIEPENRDIYFLLPDLTWQRTTSFASH